MARGVWAREALGQVGGPGDVLERRAPAKCLKFNPHRQNSLHFLLDFLLGYGRLRCESEKLYLM